MSEPTFTSETLAERWKAERDFKAEAQGEIDCCQFDPRRLSPRAMSEYRAFMPTIKMEACTQPASWEVQLDYWDKDSPMTKLCMGHFIMLPARADGGIYRIRRIKRG